MKLYSSPLACSLAPHIVLRELGLSFTLERVDAATKLTDAGTDFWKINPKGYIPALELDDGELLTEGPAIMQYLADRYSPGTLAPLAGTVARARVTSHLNYIGTELHKPFGPLFDAKSLPDERAAAKSYLYRRFDLIERELAERGPFLGGSDYSLADIYLFVVQNWGSYAELDLDRFTATRVHANRVGSRPNVQAALAAEGR